ncbi:MAG: hypothetical protein U1E51_16565 [Candidatus Binatia bacterium]|nr:hypothetical protein [Candidatus Binatia bacterium]
MTNQKRLWVSLVRLSVMPIAVTPARTAQSQPSSTCQSSRAETESRPAPGARAAKIRWASADINRSGIDSQSNVKSNELPRSKLRGIKTATPEKLRTGLSEASFGEYNPPRDSSSVKG